MIKFFRHIRRRLLAENRFSRYLLYAIGEIVLVVIGILIALQVNGSREMQRSKARERVFLNGLRSDLLLSIDELQRSIDLYNTNIRSAQVMLDCFEGRRTLSPDSFSYHAMSVLYRDPFHRNNSTMKELISSGSLGLLSDDSLKKALLSMELEHDRIDYYQDHIRHDYDEFLYSVFFRTGDVEQAFNTYLAMATSTYVPGTQPMAPEIISALLSDQTFKNGMSLCKINGKDIIGHLQAMMRSTERSLARIEAQLND